METEGGEESLAEPWGSSARPGRAAEGQGSLKCKGGAHDCWGHLMIRVAAGGVPGDSFLGLGVLGAPSSMSVACPRGERAHIITKHTFMGTVRSRASDTSCTPAGEPVHTTGCGREQWMISCGQSPLKPPFTKRKPNKAWRHSAGMTPRQAAVSLHASASLSAGVVTIQSQGHRGQQVTQTPPRACSRS